MNVMNLLSRPQLMRLLERKIGLKNNFTVSVGKSGKYLRKYLSEKEYEKFLETYSIAVETCTKITFGCKGNILIILCPSDKNLEITSSVKKHSVAETGSKPVVLLIRSNRPAACWYMSDRCLEIETKQYVKLFNLGELHKIAQISCKICKILIKKLHLIV